MNTMHFLAASLFVLQLAGTPTPEQKPRADASIEGIVVRFDTGEPLRRAQLTLTQVRPPAELAAAPPSAGDKTGPPEFPPIAPVVTESNGVFRFTSLPPGSYRLRVACNGYVSTEYGKQTTGGQGIIITLAAGQTQKDISFRLHPAATVTGHIRESDGTPMTGLSVSLLRVGYDSIGTRSLQSVASSATDDRGEFRLFWVSPGRYYLSAGTTDMMSIMSGRNGNFVQEKSSLPFYYPGTFDIARAAIIDVLPGAEMAAMDIVMTRPVTYRIKGTIADIGSGKPPRSVEMNLLPRSETELTVDAFGGRSENVTYSNGVFEFANVLPGSYLLRASATPDFDAPLAAGDVAAARTRLDLFGIAFGRPSSDEVPVEISASDLTGLTLTLRPGLSVAVRVSVDGRAISSLPDFEKIRVGLWPRRNGQFDWSAEQHTPLNAEGIGTIDKVGNGEYRVVIEPSDQDIYIKEAAVDNTDALNGFWKLSGTPSGALKVVLGEKPGRVEGTLTDSASKPASGVQVVLIPENIRHRFELYKTADTDENGRFAFRGVEPGDYRVFSWEALEPYSWFDREVLLKYEPQGKLVRVTEASQQTVDIKLIPAPKE